MTFSDRYGPWALVAGASTGLGAAFAAEAAARGVNVVIAARRADALGETAERIRQKYAVEVRPLVLDMAAPHAPTTMADAVSDIDVGLMIYNAAAEPQGLFLKNSEEMLRLNIAVNCVTPTLLTQKLAARMVERRRGGIVLVSSMGALQGIKIFAAYGAAKAYELILAEGLWDELREQGVDAFAYVVGATATPNFLNNAAKMTPDPDRLAAAIAESGQAVGEPRTPEEVAATLFALFDRGEGFEPRHYSHPDDAARALSDATRPRSQVVGEMGRMTSAMWY